MMMMMWCVMSSKKILFYFIQPQRRAEMLLGRYLNNEFIFRWITTEKNLFYFNCFIFIDGIFFNMKLIGKLLDDGTILWNSTNNTKTTRKNHITRAFNHVIKMLYGKVINRQILFKSKRSRRLCVFISFFYTFEHLDDIFLELYFVDGGEVCWICL